MGGESKLRYGFKSGFKRISASNSLTIGPVSYLPGLLVTNTQICKRSLILILWSDFTLPGHNTTNLLISRAI